MQITLDIPNPPKNQEIIEIPLHFCGGKVVEAGGYGFEEHKTGRWISEIAEGEDWKGIKRKYFQPTSCSVCHKPSNIVEEYPYCPHCGAKMEGSVKSEKEDSIL